MQSFIFVVLTGLLGLVHSSRSGFPSTCPKVSQNTNGTLGVCPNDFTIIGPELQAVHESTAPPTGLAVDADLNIYLTYTRNSGPTPANVVLCTNFTGEEPWPNAAIQNCTEGQNVSSCFVNVQNVVLDSTHEVLWAVDSGIFAGQSSPTPGGAKVMSFNISTRELLRTYTVPSSLLYDDLSLNDMQVNLTLGNAGFVFMTDSSKGGSILTIDLEDGRTFRRLHNTSVVMGQEGYVSGYDGRPIYGWNGKTKVPRTTASDSIAIASGNLYWGVLTSRNYYYLPQTVLTDPDLTDDELLKQVRFPGSTGSEQGSFTSDDRGRLYIAATEQNAIFYVDTQQREVVDEVNGVPPGGEGEVAPENYVVKTLVRNALIQHADSAAIFDGWLYFCTNQIPLAPFLQYGGVDARRGPFRSYRIWIGRGPAV